MALKLSKNSGLTDVVSSDGSISNPIQTSHPVEGSAQTVQMWIFNDNSSKKYQNVSIQAVDAVGTSEANWIQLSLDNVTYQAAGASLTIPDITTANTGTTFYVKVTTPTVADTINKSDIKLKTSFTEYAV